MNSANNLGIYDFGAVMGARCFVAVTLDGFMVLAHRDGRTAVRKVSTMTQVGEALDGDGGALWEMISGSL